jgi:geranylgeranyl pyrophosphate synthase
MSPKKFKDKCMTLENALQAVDDLLLSVVDSSVPLLRETSQHILGAGGKRLRPRLTLLAHLVCNGQQIEQAVPLAAAIEIIHTATLVHDDINDHGTLRRGRETVNSRWGRTYALLTGDYMFTKAYHLMAPYSAELNEILAQAAVELVEGETLQIQASKAGTLDHDIYLEIITKKTASLFVGAVKLGATSANAPTEWIDALREYAFNLGLAFQIVDDVLDLVADPEQIGKNAGIDMLQGRGIGVVTGNGKNGGAEVLEQYTVEIAAEKGRSKAAEFAALAVNALSTLPPSAAVDDLRDLARLVVERNR